MTRLTTRPTIEYRILVGEDDWFPIAHLAPADLVALWSGSDHLTCCGMQGGFAIRTDDRPWNEDSLDEIRMSTTWLDATLALVRGQTVAQVWAWEESAMTLIRRGEVLELFDVHPSGHVVCPRIVVPLRSFAEALAHAASDVARLFDGVTSLAATLPDERRDVIRENIDYPWAERVEAIRDALTRPLVPEDASLAPPPLHLAIKLDDRDVTFAADEVERVHGGARPLHLAVCNRRAWAVEALLAAGADVHAPDASGRTPLLEAVTRLDLAITKRLLAAGADPNARGGYFFTPLEQCALGALHGPIGEMRTLLVSAGATPNLFTAIAEGDIAATIAFAREGRPRADALGLWVKRLRSEVFHKMGTADERITAWRPAIDAMLAAGAAWSDGKRPAIHEAVLFGDADLMRALLALGLDPRAVDERGVDALGFAEQYRVEAVIPMLRAATGVRA